MVVPPCRIMSPSCLAGLAIIVVEDHDDARRYLDLFLGHLGAKVMVARNAFEGLEAIKNTHPDLVLSDIKMPGMDGFELLDEIRALGPDAGGSVPVIAMSAFADRSNAHASRRFSGMPSEAIHSRQISGNNFGYSLKPSRSC
jgi:CheY-like chemotaxis protein